MYSCFAFEGGGPLGNYPGGWIRFSRYLYDFASERAEADVCLYTRYFCRCFHLYTLVGKITDVIQVLKNLAHQANVNQLFLETILKIIGIAYIAEFGAQVTRDAGQGSIAAKIELAGKVLIMVMAIPIITVIIETIVQILPS